MERRPSADTGLIAASSGIPVIIANRIIMHGGVESAMMKVESPRFKFYIFHYKNPI